MAVNSESTKEVIRSYLDKNSLRYKDNNKDVDSFVLGFSYRKDQDIQFKLVISVQEGGDFIQFFSLLKLKPNFPDFQKRLLQENLEKKLIKWSADEEKNVVCSVDILIDYKEEISHNQIERALQSIQSSIVALSDLFSFE
ncbi:hypothetical protein RDV50_00815 [Neisseria subflava]|uniref:hypothetical protein n=1 Tax=Neisseria subflava TaxID=28449 RepID=UPI0010BEF4F0|nr:hypothetical protein [Neisseria subflava]QCL70592.1 hypothetical protein FAH66_03205 [Neisseria subflava]WMS17927.1 hypothetical protein RDV50_00815 [Neisseria subflava]